MYPEIEEPHAPTGAAPALPAGAAPVAEAAQPGYTSLCAWQLAPLSAALQAQPPWK